MNEWNFEVEHKVSRVENELEAKSSRIYASMPPILKAESSAKSWKSTSTSKQQWTGFAM